MSTPDVLETFTRLLAQSRSSKAASWSTRTVERALGWAKLAETAGWEGQAKPQYLLLVSLYENPFSTIEVAKACKERIVDLTGGREDASLTDIAVECATTIQSSITSEELVKRVAAKQLSLRCRQDEKMQLLVRSKIESGSPWFREALCRIILAAEIPTEWMMHCLTIIQQDEGRGVPPQIWTNYATNKSTSS